MNVCYQVNKPSKNKSEDSKEKVRPSSSSKSSSSSSSSKNEPAGLFNFRKVNIDELEW